MALNNLQSLICHKTQPKQNPIYLIYMYKQYLALNNLEGLIYHKTQPIIISIIKNDKINGYLTIFYKF